MSRLMSNPNLLSDNPKLKKSLLPVVLCYQIIPRNMFLYLFHHIILLCITLALNKVTHFCLLQHSFYINKHLGRFIFYKLYSKDEIN